MKDSKLYEAMKHECSIRMGWAKDVDYYMSYLTQFPEKKWFYTTNAAANPFPNQIDMMRTFLRAGLIESRTVPMYVNGNLKGVVTYFRYSLDLDYNHENPDTHAQNTL